MEEKINAMSAAEALREWKYAKAQSWMKKTGPFVEATKAYKNLCHARLSQIWTEHEIHDDGFGQIRLNLAKYDPKELEALLTWHNSK